MSNELIINASLPETRIALMEDGQIQELLIERASGKGIVGNIYKGRVTRVLPGMQAAFVDIGLEKAAFLYVDDVYVHSEIWEEEEGGSPSVHPLSEVQAEAEMQRNPSEGGEAPRIIPLSEQKIQARKASAVEAGEQAEGDSAPAVTSGSGVIVGPGQSESESDEIAREHLKSDDEHEGYEDDDHGDHGDEDDSGKPVDMGVPPDDSDEVGSGKSAPVEGTIAPDKPAKAERKPRATVQSKAAKEALITARANAQLAAQQAAQENQDNASGSDDDDDDGGGDQDNGGDEGGDAASDDPTAAGGRNKRHRRGKRGGRMRRRVPGAPAPVQAPLPQRYSERDHERDHERDLQKESAEPQSERASLEQEGRARASIQENERQEAANHPAHLQQAIVAPSGDRPEFRSQRSRDRKIRPKSSSRMSRPQVNIQDLLKEGQEVLVQVAKDPIATKGARLTCHISLPGRHLVCMPTIDHVGVSRRIDREEERRRLREYVERNRPKNLGFIVRTASGKQQSEKRIKQDIDYLTRLWSEIKEKAATVTAPALVYEDLNVVLRAIRDWVTEEIDKVIVDSRYHFNDVIRFVSHFMPPMKQKVELYHGDIPIFDAYGISTELSRALERKVWLKSGGYIVVDQAEALVAIDVNTGRYVGKKNLEDTILKTNLEAVQEVAYQLRLRNCGGIIIIDLIDMEKEENRQRVYRALEEALQKDRARPTIIKISELGLIEMTRKRTRDTIVRSLCESCNHCEGKGFIKSKQTVAYEVMREIEREGIERDVSKILVQAHSEVIDVLAIDERESLDHLERRYRKTIYLQAVVDFHPEQFEVSVDKGQRPEKGRDSEQTVSPPSEPRGRGRDRGKQGQSHRQGHAERPAPVIIPLAVPLVPVSPISSAPVEAGTEAKGVVQRPPERVSDEDYGNRADSGPPVITPREPVEGANVRAAASGDEPFDEEDRLAFLRAQAAQDAALARLNNGHSTAPTRTADASHRGGDRNDRGGGGGGMRRGMRGRRNANPNANNSKFRRGPANPNNGPGFRNVPQANKPAATGPVPTPISAAAPSSVPSDSQRSSGNRGGETPSGGGSGE